jgi:hypothetical protein
LKPPGASIGRLVSQQSCSERIGAPFNTGGSVAAMSKELRTVMAKAVEDAQVGADPLDQLRARRLQKLRM